MGVLKRIILILCTVSMLISSLLSSLFLLPALAFAGTCWNGGSIGSAPWSVVNSSGEPSVEYSDVNYCVNTIAASGETVNLPAGSATWGTKLAIAKAIKIVGAGIGCPDSCDNATIIINGGISAPNYLISIIPAAPADNPSVDISGITFDCNAAGNGILIQSLDLTYNYYNFRIHHNAIKNASSAGIFTSGFTYGLIDHNLLDNNWYNLDIRGREDQYTSLAWAKYTKDVDNTLLYSGLGMGGADFLFSEQNKSTNHRANLVHSGECARWVSRYNTIVDGGGELWDIHGDIGNSGVIAAEIYENTHTATTLRSYLRMVDYRGGTAMVYNNSLMAVPTGVVSVITLREETADCALRNGFDMKIHNGYLWNNINSTGAVNNTYIYTGENSMGTTTDPYNCLTEGIDYWMDTQNASQTPTSYFTKDVHANRNLTRCIAEDVYWETDTIIDGEHSAGALYRCTTTNNWELIYSPYQYPHPLQGISNKGTTVINTVGGLNAINIVGGLNVINQ